MSTDEETIAILRARLAECERERDEARADLATERAAREKAERERDSIAQRKGGGDWGGVAEMQARCEEMLKARDEATEMLAAVREDGTRWLVERDTARAESARLTARLAEVEAREAGLREALETERAWIRWCSRPRDLTDRDRELVKSSTYYLNGCELLDKVLDAALSPDAGRALLDRHAAEIARKDAALREAAKLCRCRGTGTYEPSCSMCHDSTWDHECPPARKCRDDRCLAVRAALLPNGAA